MSVHDGHRARIKERFLETGLDSFQDYEVLELLLFYAVPRGDVNPLAHELVDRFGSLAKVLDAPLSALEKVPGIGHNTAVLIKLIPEVARKYQISRVSNEQTLTSSRLIVDYLSPLFFGARDENFYAVYLDAQCTVITCRLLSSGSANSTPVDIRKVVELALECNATSIVVAHNHTTSSSEPSQADLDTTFRLRSALTPLGIFLLDHIIFSTVDWLSMHDNGILD